jgi:hypothetical protein
MDLNPFLKWTLALIAGGGAAGIFQGGSVLLRGKSALTTGGAGNPLLAAGETLGATALSVLAILIPVLLAAAVLAACAFVLWRFGRALSGRRGAA